MTISTRFLRALLALLLCTPLLSRAAPPNIVVFIADDLSLLDTSVYGGTDYRTPNLARLAAAGMTFTHAFVASPSCAPSRAALLTGLYPARNGCEPNHAKAREDVEKLPRRFAALGYEIAAFGKVAHYGHGKFYGFDNIQFEGFHDHRGIPAAVKLLKNREPSSAKPLCLFVGTNWPHRPWPPNEGYSPAALTLPPTQVDTPATREWRARYATAVTKFDDDLDAIYDAVRERLGEKTLFLFSSDHGAQCPFGKWTLYDAGIRVPTIVSWPGVVKPGSRSDAMVSWIDFLPTLLEAARSGDIPVAVENPLGEARTPAGGAGAPQGDRNVASPWTAFDGRSFLSVLRGEKTKLRDRIFTTHSGDKEMNVYPCRSLRTREWKYILNLHPEFQYTSHVDRAADVDEIGYFRSWDDAAKSDAHAAAIVQRYRQRPRDELYDLRADPFEMNNLAADPAQAGRVSAMRAEVEGWMREQGDEGRVFNKPVLLDPAPR